MRPSDQTSWFPFATTLAETGDYTVLTFDFRGYGESTGDKQFDRIDTDLESAFEYMRDALSIEEIFIIGASMGGTAALIAGERLSVAGIVSISSPSQFPPLDAEATVGGITAPKLFITSEDDVPAERSQEQFWELAQEPKEQVIYEGDAHGTDIFDSPNGKALEQRLLDFLEAH
jgi:pimeloyl-ACP methyl ester carboxylesterase